ncbi:MAG: tetratricopeptide repeat protein [Treponema sp.]|jgi:tetratricopeptide (TPR) repeat protein|nr:tetratricopeptide repeat protein [Treponema sp.]
MVDKNIPGEPGKEAQVYPLREGPGIILPGSRPAEGPSNSPLSPVPPKAPGPAAPLKTLPEAITGRGGGRLQEGIRLFRMKRYDLALKELSMVDGALFSPEENSELAYYLGLCHTKLEHYEEALLYLDQVISGSQNVLRSYQCRMTLAYIYVITRKTKMAEFELARLQKSGFESVQLYTTMAYAAWVQRNVKGALDYYERALDMDENNTTAMNGLGYILVETNNDLIRGLRLCRRAVDRKPQNPAYLDSLGWACFKNGEILEARGWLKRAIDLAPREKEIQDHWRIITGEEPPRGR